MSFIHGKNTVFKIDDSGGTLRDISAYCNSVSFPRSADTAETSTFSVSSKTFVAGLKGATISVEGKWDSTVDGYLDGIVGVEGTFEYGPQGSTAGNIKYTGECICTGYEPSGDIGDAGKFTASFQVTGDVERTTF